MELTQQIIDNFKIDHNIFDSNRHIYIQQFYQDYEYSTPAAGDIFFQEFCIGNAVKITHKPFERYLDYENVLTFLNTQDPNKYRVIHKGTPFFFGMVIISI